MIPKMTEDVKGLLGEAGKAFKMEGSGSAKVGLFECHKDIKTFLCVCCCPACAYVQVGLNAQALRGGDKYNEMCKACCFGSCWNICLRQEIR